MYFIFFSLQCVKTVYQAAQETTLSSIISATENVEFKPAFLEFDNSPEHSISQTPDPRPDVITSSSGDFNVVLSEWEEQSSPEHSISQTPEPRPHVIGSSSSDLNVVLSEWEEQSSPEHSISQTPEPRPDVITSSFSDLNVVLSEWEEESTPQLTVQGPSPPPTADLINTTIKRLAGALVNHVSGSNNSNQLIQKSLNHLKETAQNRLSNSSLDRRVKEDIVRRKEAEREKQMEFKNATKEGDTHIGLKLTGIYYDQKSHFQCIYCDKILVKSQKARHMRICKKKTNFEDMTISQAIADIKIPSTKPAGKTCTCYICNQTVSVANIARHVREIHNKTTSVPLAPTTNAPVAKGRGRGRPKKLNIKCNMCSEMLSKKDEKEHYKIVHNTDCGGSGQKGKKNKKKGNNKKVGKFFFTSKYHLKYFISNILAGKIPSRTVRVTRVDRKRLLRNYICRACKVQIAPNFVYSHFVYNHKCTLDARKQTHKKLLPAYNRCYIVNYRHSKIRPRIETMEKEYSVINNRKFLMLAEPCYKLGKNIIRGYNEKMCFRGRDMFKRFSPETEVSDIKINLVNRRTLCKKWAVGNEVGLGSFHHTHAFVQTTKQHVKINAFRKFLIRRCRFVTDVTAVRNESHSIKYVTKEDVSAILVNVDKEEAHHRHQFETIYQRYKCRPDNFNNTLYANMKWNSIFRQTQFQNYFDSQIDQFQLDAAVARCEPYINWPVFHEIEQCQKKGIWLYGEPGVGKSCTVLWYTKGAHYDLPQIVNQFMFDSWQRQKIIVADDVTIKWAENISRTINNLTDDKGLCLAEKKGGRKFYVTCDKLIITSNEGPPDWEGFERRFHCINVTKYVAEPLPLTPVSYSDHSSA